MLDEFTFQRRHREGTAHIASEWIRRCRTHRPVDVATYRQVSVRPTVSGPCRHVVDQLESRVRRRTVVGEADPDQWGADGCRHVGRRGAEAIERDRLSVGRHPNVVVWTVAGQIHRRHHRRTGAGEVDLAWSSCAAQLMKLLLVLVMVMMMGVDWRHGTDSHALRRQQTVSLIVCQRTAYIDHTCTISHNS